MKSSGYRNRCCTEVKGEELQNNRAGWSIDLLEKQHISVAVTGGKLEQGGVLQAGRRVSRP